MGRTFPCLLLGSDGRRQSFPFLAFGWPDLSLITSAKTLFPNEVTFTGTGGHGFKSSGLFG